MMKMHGLASDGYREFSTARYMDPRLGKFISTDAYLDRYLPTGDKEKDKKLAGHGGVFNPVNLNLYEYAGDNPLKFIDPDGNEWKPFENFQKAISDLGASKKGGTGGGNTSNSPATVEGATVPIAESRDPAITSHYGSRPNPFGSGSSEFHSGLDIVPQKNPDGSWLKNKSDRLNTPILSVSDGKVSFAGVKSGYGNAVVVDNGYDANGKLVQTLVGHLANIGVTVGDNVSRGDPLGGMGSVGRSTGPHVHYEVIVDGGKVDPINFDFSSVVQPIK